MTSIYKSEEGEGARYRLFLKYWPVAMPVLAIVGGKDELLDSAETKRRLEHHVSHAEVRYLPEAGHVLRSQTAPILEFLLGISENGVDVPEPQRRHTYP